MISLTWYKQYLINYRHLQAPYQLYTSIYRIVLLSVAEYMLEKNGPIKKFGLYVHYHGYWHILFWNCVLQALSLWIVYSVISIFSSRALAHWMAIHIKSVWFTFPHRKNFVHQKMVFWKIYRLRCVNDKVQIFIFTFQKTSVRICPIT